MEQRTKEWFAARVGLVTGSRVGAILGLAPYQTRKEVMRAMVREHHGAESEFVGNVATVYGTNNEQNAIDDFHMFEDLGKIEEVGFIKHPEFDWLGASPDGFIGDDTVVEIKCPFSLRNEELPFFKTAAEQPHYYAQMQIELECSERTKCLFIQWTPAAYKIEEVAYDGGWMDENLPELAVFYKEFLKEIESPEKHLEPKIKEIKRDDIARQYREAKEALETAQEDMKQVKDLIIKTAGNNNSVSISGIKAAKITRKGSVKYASIPELKGVDLDSFRGPGSTYWKVG